MEKMIFQWVHHILSIEACDAIRRELNCFISMINSVATLCGFTPLGNVSFNVTCSSHSEV